MQEVLCQSIYANYLLHLHLLSSRSSIPLKLHPLFFFFNDTATTEIYTLSLHDALPISGGPFLERGHGADQRVHPNRSEEHTSELQSRFDLVCRLLLEKKKRDMLSFSIFKKKTSNRYNEQIKYIM